MATVGTDNIGLADYTRRTDPDGKLAKVVELMNDKNEFMDDMHYMECNNGSNHITTVRTGLPSGTWRKLYGGVGSTKSATAQVSDSTGMLEARPKIDVDVIKRQKDQAAALLSEQTPHLEGLAQDIATQFIYGDTAAHPERFMGLAPRYDAIGTDDTLSTYNVMSGGGSGSDNTSIWLVTWGQEQLSMLFPEGSNAGLTVDNKGIESTTAAGGGDFDAYVTKYKWDLGLTVRDWRSVGRIANIDISALEAASSAADLITLMIKMSERVEATGGRQTWLMHKRVRTMLRLQILATSNVNLTFENVAGKRVLMFDGIPIRASDAITVAEAVVP